MIFSNFHLICLLNVISFAFFSLDSIAEERETSPSQYVSNEVWLQVKDYLISDDHPVKIKLDKIFSASRALHNMRSMVAAGFDHAIPQHHTEIIVTRHPKIKGYVIKAFLDSQRYHSGKPEYYFWLKRTKGSNLIRESIKTHKYEKILKVPQKWLYLIPDLPASSSKYVRKNFILVAEDMDLLSAEENEQRWGSSKVTKETLTALYTVITEHGFWDCAKPDNCPFSKDGRIALIDTQVYNSSYIKYHNLTPYLLPETRAYWKYLTSSGKVKLIVGDDND